MGRTRKLDCATILQAAERVALRDGATGLTLKAVADCAGVGKATVLYDYKTMDGLVIALFRHLLDQEEKRLVELQMAIADEPDAAIRARIAAADRSLSANERSLISMIVAALANNPELKAAARDFFDRSVAEVSEASTFPRSAVIGLLAIHGLVNLRSLDLFDWEADALRTLLADIEAVARNPLPVTPGRAAAADTPPR